MPAKALIVYSTWYGSTEDIARVVADAIATSGAEEVVARARDVSTVAEYDAVVIGSAVRMGKPHKDAIAFIKKFGPELASKRTALFISCMTRAADTEESRKIGESYLDMLKMAAPGIAPLAPLAADAFGGTFDKEKSSLLVRAMFWIMKVKPSDYRNWDAIRKWAEDAAKVLVAA